MQTDSLTKSKRRSDTIKQVPVKIAIFEDRHRRITNRTLLQLLIIKYKKGYLSITRQIAFPYFLQKIQIYMMETSHDLANSPKQSAAITCESYRCKHLFLNTPIHSNCMGRHLRKRLWCPAIIDTTWLSIPHIDLSFEFIKSRFSFWSNQNKR